MAFKYDSEVKILEEGRSGRLDKLVSFLSVGHLGIYTQVISEERTLTKALEYWEEEQMLENRQVVKTIGRGEKGTKIQLRNRIKRRIIWTPPLEL